MTKKDYEVIATAFVTTVQRAYNGEKGYKLAVAYMADELERNNPKFDRSKFYNACGINTWTCNKCKAVFNEYSDLHARTC